MSDDGSQDLLVRRSFGIPSQDIGVGVRGSKGPGESTMESEQAKRVQAGDTAIYRRTRHRIVAVHNDGFWAPYFELEGAGVIGHALIDSVEIRPADHAPRIGGRASAVLTPELGI
jgi:hypothetical protein